MPSITYLAAAHTHRCHRSHTWRQSIQTGVIDHIPGGSPYTQVPSITYLAAYTDRCHRSHTWRQPIHTGTIDHIPGSPYTQVPSITYLAAHTHRCHRSHTWRQSIHKGAIDYIPGGSPYRQMPGRTKSRSVAKPRRMAAEFAACTLTPLLLNDQRQHTSITTSD